MSDKRVLAGQLVAAADGIESVAPLLVTHVAIMREAATALLDTPKWIPVSERLPDQDRQLVVVFDPTNDPLVWPAQWVEANQTFDSDGGWFEADEVTHWMPLPEPPKG